MVADTRNMRDLRQWLCWRSEERDGKPTKIPYSPLTGQIKGGTKAWSIFEACLGRDFHKKPGVSLESLVGKQFIGQVTATRTGSRNKVEFGTIGPVPPEVKNPAPEREDGGGGDMFDDIPF